MSRSPRCLYYALGGGMGHGMRTLSLARQLLRYLGGQHRILVNSPFSSTLAQLTQQEQHIAMVHLSPDADARIASAFLRQILLDFPPDLLVVDTFPRGLGGEFARLASPWPGKLAVLISRTLPAAYVRAYDLPRFVAAHYPLVIVAGESSPFARLPQSHRSAPFLIRDATELPSQQQAACLLGVPQEVSTILLVASGSLQECQAMQQIAAAMTRWDFLQGYALRLALPAVAISRSTVPVVTHVPLLECLRAVLLVIGQGGYNLFHETAALRVPAIFWPRPRKYDDQFRRVAAYPCITGLEDLLRSVREQLSRRAAPDTPPLYDNGAAQAAHRIAAAFTDAGNSRGPFSSPHRQSE